jgi:hypothetical protein
MTRRIEMPVMQRLLCICLLFFIAGCQSRLNEQRTYFLDTGAIQTLDISPPRVEQKVTVTIDTDAPISALVYLRKDANTVEKDLTLKQKSDKALGSRIIDKSGTIDVTVPAHEVAVVRLEATRKAANVTVKIVGQ